MNIGYTSGPNSYSFYSGADHCESCGGIMLPYCYGRKCCEYHTRISHTPAGDCETDRCCPKFCKAERREIQLHILDKYPVKYCVRVVKSIKDNELSFLRAYLTQYPSYVDGLLPYQSRDEYEDEVTHHSLLQIAVLERNPEAVELILQHNPDLEKEPYPLLLACHKLRDVPYQCGGDARNCLSDRLLDIIGHLLKAGANPNIIYPKTSGKTSISTKTPLTCCVRGRSIAAVRTLLSHGARLIPDIGKDKNSVKILQEICRVYLGSGLDCSNNILSLLIDAGLDVNAYYGDLQLIHIMCDSDFSRTNLRALINRGANINATNKAGNFTALHQIIIGRYESLSPEFIFELLELGANFFIQCKVPKDYAEFFPEHLHRILKNKKTYDAIDLLPDHLPRDRSFYVSNNEEQVMAKPVADVTAEKVSVANRNPSLLSRIFSYFSGATNITGPDVSEPGQQECPTPAGASHATNREDSALTSHPRHCNPGAATPVVSGQHPPSYDSLFPVNNKSSSRSPEREPSF